MFFMAKTSTDSNLLKERIQRWGSQVRSNSSIRSSSSFGSETDSHKKIYKISEPTETLAHNHTLIRPPSKEALVYLEAISGQMQIEGNHIAPSSNLVSDPRPVTPEEKKSTFGLFLQGAKEGFTPIDSVLFGNHQPDHKITNTSILAVRYNSSQSRSMRDHKFQWYRSSMPRPTIRGLVQETEWTVIYGATRAVYQPSVTDCGYQLKCVITVDENSDDEDEEHHPTKRTSSTHECTLDSYIEMDPDIFNQARNYLHTNHCASFDHLLGCGNAEGKILRITIEQGQRTYGSVLDLIDPMNMVASNMFIYQLSGNSETLLHDVNTPIYNATAEADSTRSNILHIVLPIDLPEAAKEVESLATHRRLELYAEDRVTRETLLTVLGIANFNGNSSQLSVQSTLFPPSDHLKNLPPPRVSPVRQKPSSVHAVSLMKGEIGTKDLSSIVHSEVSLFACADKKRLTSDCIDNDEDVDDLNIVCREQPSPIRVSRTMRQEASDLQTRLEALEKVLKQKDFDLVQCEETIHLERRKCEELRLALNAAEKRIDLLYEDRIQMRKDMQGQISSLERSLATSQEILQDRCSLMASLEARNVLLSETIESKNQEINELSSLKKQILVFSQRDMLLQKMESTNEVDELVRQLQRRLVDSETQLNEMNSTLKEVEEQKVLNHDLQQIVSDLQIRINHLEEMLCQKDDQIQANELAFEAGKIQNQELQLALNDTMNLLELNRNEEIVKRDELLLRLSCLEKDIVNHADTVQRYENLILSLQEEKEALRGSGSDDPNLPQRLDSDLLYVLLRSGEEATRERDLLTTKLSALESELEKKVSALHEYESLIASLRDGKKASFSQEPLLTPQKKRTASLDSSLLQSPFKDDLVQIASDRDCIRSALTIISKELVVNQDSLMRKEESCDKLNLVIDELNKALIHANTSLQNVEKEKKQLLVKVKELEKQRNSVQVVCGCFARRR